jgi:tetratricopeptide (TPR) repeat protein
VHLLLDFFLVKGKIAGDIHLDVIQNTSGVLDIAIIEKELKSLDKAIKLSPKKYLYHATRANLNCRLNRFDEAIKDYNNIFSFMPDYAEGYLHQGMIYDWIGEDSLGNVCYDKANSLYELRINNESDSESIFYHPIKSIIYFYSAR